MSGLLDDLAAGDEVDQTNQLLAHLIRVTAEANDLDEQDLGYFGGGESTASTRDLGRSTASTTESRDARQHFGGQVGIDGTDNRDDPRKVTLPFEARSLDVRAWSGTVYVAYSDPTNTDDPTYWHTLDGSRDDPVGSIPCETGTLWFATPDGNTADPLIDAWRERP